MVLAGFASARRGRHDDAKRFWKYAVVKWPMHRLDFSICGNLDVVLLRSDAELFDAEHLQYSGIVLSAQGLKG